MAYVATLQKPWISGSASLVPTWVDDAVATTTLITGFDGGNASSGLSSITGAATLTPTLEIDSRDGNWRHLLFAVEGVEGKTPVFRLNRATMTGNAFTPTAYFLPLWTQDFVTWTQATSRTLTGGTSGTIDFSFDDPLPSGRVYVSTHPMGQNADAATFAAELLADYSSVAAPTTSADSSGVYNTTPTETGDDGRAVGGNDQYAIKLDWGGSTTDSGPKRKLVMFAGIHSAGEHVSWVSFVASVRHMLDATEAANFRANWDVYLYFNVTANGIVGGSRRQNPSRNIDPNRDFINQNLQEIDALTTAILADTGGSADAQFSWHAFSTETDDFIPGTGGSPNTETAAFITKGNTIFSSPRTYYLDIPTDGNRWGYDVLGCKIAFAAEVPMRGDTSVAFYEGIGRNWIKTLQAIDADGMFSDEIEIEAGTDTLLLTGQQALVSLPITLVAGHDSVDVSGQQAALSLPLTWVAGPDNIAVEGQQAVVGLPITVQSGAGSLDVAGQGATLGLPLTLTAQTGEIVLQGQPASFSTGDELQLVAGAGQIEVDGQQAALSVPVTLAAGVGQIVVTGQQAVVTLGDALDIVAGPGQIEVAGQKATLSAPVALSAANDSLDVIGQQAQLTLGAPLELIAGNDTIQITGQQSVVSIGNEVSLVAGNDTIAVNGQQGVFGTPLVLAASHGQIIFQGQQAALITGRGPAPQNRRFRVPAEQRFFRVPGTQSFYKAS